MIGTTEERFRLFLKSLIQLRRNELELLKNLLQDLEITENEEDRWSRQLKQLNWKPYNQGSGEWCFADTAPIDFLARLREEGSLIIDGYRYRLSQGRDREFLSRRPVKEEKP